MAAPANAGRKGMPPSLRVLNGRGTRKDGTEVDSAGREIQPGPDFRRAAPSKPAELSPDADWLWDRVIEQMTTIGLLKPIDGPALEAMCETFARYREAVRFRREHALLAKYASNTVAAPWIGIEERASKEFRAWCAEFGITPAAERNLVGQEATNGGTDSNPF